MNEAHLLAFLHHDYPQLHAHLVAHPDLQTAVIGRLRELYGAALINRLAQLDA
ncbi:MAG: hypothetical protein IPG96_21605 [Proteobacteria bacterium]|nr:hypothetical protein [Pseudomonadota bacterium]